MFLTFLLFGISWESNGSETSKGFGTFFALAATDSTNIPTTETEPSDSIASDSTFTPDPEPSDSTFTPNPEPSDSTFTPDPEPSDSTFTPDPEPSDSTFTPDPEPSDSTFTPDPEPSDSTFTPDPEPSDSTFTPDPEPSDSTFTPDPEPSDSTFTPDPEPSDSTFTPDPEPSDSTFTPEPEPSDSTGIANTPETAYTIAQAHQLIETGQELETQVYIKGVITSIKEVDLTYGNATYNIGDTEADSDPLEIYRGLYYDGAKFTGESQIKVGDEVVIYGQLADYNGKHQMNANSSVYTLNGKRPADISNTPETAYTVAEALQLLEAGEGLGTAVYIKGLIAEIEEINTDFGNASYYLSKGDTTDSRLYVYRGRYFYGEQFTATDQLQVGDEVVIYGQLSIFNAKPQVNSGNTLYALNGKTEPPAPDTDISNTPETAYTIAEALQLLETGEGLETSVYITGKVDEVQEINTYFGNATYYLSDADSTGGRLMVYRGAYLNGEVFTSTEQLLPGYGVVVYGRLAYFNGTPEITGSHIHSLDKPEQQQPELTWSRPRFAVDLNGAGSAAYPVLQCNSDGKISYTSSDYRVAVIDSVGEIIPRSTGFVTITAQVAATAVHTTATASFTLEVFDSSLPLQPSALVVMKDSTYYAMLIADAQSGNTFDATAATVLNGRVVTDHPDTCSWLADRKTGTISTTDGTACMACADGSLALQAGTYGWTFDGYLWQTTDGDRQLAIGLGSRAEAESGYAFDAWPTADVENGTYLTPQVLPVVEGYIREVTPGQYGTLCLPYSVSAGDYDGAEFFSIVGKTLTGDEVTGIIVERTDSLEAGQPYIYSATGGRLVAVYGQRSVTTPAENSNGLIGTFTGTTVGEGMYLLTDNTVKQTGAAGGSIGANRAYIDLDRMSVCAEPTNVNQRLIVLDGHEDGTVDIEATVTDDNSPVEVYTLGGMRIRSGVPATEATKGLPKGVYIVSGRKVIVK